MKKNKNIKTIWCLTNKAETKFLKFTIYCKDDLDNTETIIDSSWISHNFFCHLFFTKEKISFNARHKDWIKKRKAHWIWFKADLTQGQ